RIHGRKLRLVERIVQLPAELESSCAAEPDVLEERNVRVDVAGQSQLVTMRCPGSIRRKTRRRDAFGTKVPVGCLVTPGQIRIAREIDTGIDTQTASARQVRNAGDAVRDSTTQSAEIRSDPRDLPPGKSMSRDRVVPETCGARNVVRVMDR